ncbi:hypothetical protein BDV95DRAFT_590349 [Massariosphaeria phaeospora]|uniref:Uncharacterized protein n=1 Tax=Massariosphaeria phaeospora TaxID=100035 RepID=A0A7C8ML83_9PLEO|nr:hypothetical protein BDV95DRAFT_590349 [Massariosphaeria phaeospora]
MYPRFQAASSAHRYPVLSAAERSFETPRPSCGVHLLSTAFSREPNLQHGAELRSRILTPLPRSPPTSGSTIRRRNRQVSESITRFRQKITARRRTRRNSRQSDPRSRSPTSDTWAPVPRAQHLPPIYRGLHTLQTLVEATVSVLLGTELSSTLACQSAPENPDIPPSTTARPSPVNINPAAILPVNLTPLDALIYLHQTISARMLLPPSMMQTTARTLPQQASSLAARVHPPLRPRVPMPIAAYVHPPLAFEFAIPFGTRMPVWPAPIKSSPIPIAAQVYPPLRPRFPIPIAARVWPTPPHLRCPFPLVAQVWPPVPRGVYPTIEDDWRAWWVDDGKGSDEGNAAGERRVLKGQGGHNGDLSDGQEIVGKKGDK